MNTKIISDNIKKYIPYFIWNEAFVNHYFTQHENGEIRLHIDKNLLTELGETEKIQLNVEENFETNFKNTVLNFCSTFYGTKNILRVALKMIEDGKFYAMTYDKRIEKTSDNKARVYDLPYLNIILYVIYVIENPSDGTQKWDNVHKSLNLGQRETLDHQAILPLWEALHLYNNSFDNNASVYIRDNAQNEDYVGRILYHLPLSATTRNKIQDAIYKSSSWKLLGTKSFWDIVRYIHNSLKPDTKANKELDQILRSCFSSDDYKGIAARKVREAIEDFDIEKYKKKLEERRNSSAYADTIISGSFALGISFPDDNSSEDVSIVLLTTVDQQIEDGVFKIKEGASGTFGGYNISFVEVNGSESVELRDYSLIKRGKYNITPLKCEDVLFFHQYDENLFIQTREIIPSESYIIAVKKSKKEEFDVWAMTNNNLLEQWTYEATADLFGKDWVIYSTENRLNGQYYEAISNDQGIINNSKFAIRNGGIKKAGTNIYFINALPNFEVPDNYDINEVKVYINLNDKEISFQKTIKGRKIIIDINDMPIYSDEIAYVDVSLECNQQIIYPSERISVCGQIINYDSTNFYKYNKYGVISNDEAFLYSGNNININNRSDNIRGLFAINKNLFDYIADDLYFINLLAACCYDSPTSEITDSRFDACVSNAIDRLNIDVQQKEIRQELINAGIINREYTTKMYQAIAPSFMKVPFSNYQSDGTQMIMLSGCYTRAFIADLREYCEGKGVNMFTVKNEKKKDEEQLLPPIILLEYNFDPKDFCDTYHHQCDILLDYDFALSLINIIPEYCDIKSKFNFSEKSDYFISMLDKTKIKVFPRIRSLGQDYNKTYYIEKSNKKFAELSKGFVGWASIYCHHEQGTPMVIISGNHVLLPSSLLLPAYVQRALYLMNLGLPKQKKVFVCNNKVDYYYTNMYYYNLGSNARCTTLATKISGEPIEGSSLVRNKVSTKCTMEYWKTKFRGRNKQERYLILYDERDTSKILAIAHDGNVYLKCGDSFKKINSESMNEALSFLINEKWLYGNGYGSIGHSCNGGETFEQRYKLVAETISIPDSNKFEKEKIQIV